MKSKHFSNYLILSLPRSTNFVEMVVQMIIQVSSFLQYHSVIAVTFSTEIERQCSSGRKLLVVLFRSEYLEVDYQILAIFLVEVLYLCWTLIFAPTVSYLGNDVCSLTLCYLSSAESRVLGTSTRYIHLRRIAFVKIQRRNFLKNSVLCDESLNQLVGLEIPVFSLYFYIPGT